MVARMTYFRTKWRALPDPYARFLASTRTGGAGRARRGPSTWPVVRVGDRHVFQAGAQGGLEPADYLRRPHTPAPDAEAPEAEWGADPGLGAAVARLVRCARPPAGPAAATGARRPPRTPSRPCCATGTPTAASPPTGCSCPSFVLGDPWRTISAAAVPYWTFFAVQPALRALEAHLAAAAAVPVGRHPAVPARGDVPGHRAPEEWPAVPAGTARDPACWPWTRAGSRTTWRRSGATTARWPGCRRPPGPGHPSTSAPPSPASPPRASTWRSPDSLGFGPRFPDRRRGCRSRRAGRVRLPGARCGVGGRAADVGPYGAVPQQAPARGGRAWSR